MTQKREIGEIGPFRKLHDDLGRWLESPIGDEKAAEAVARIRKDLERAIADAANPPADGLSIEEYAARKRITKAAAWKRFQRGSLPGAEKVPGRGIVVPFDLAS